MKSSLSPFLLPNKLFIYGRPQENVPHFTVTAGRPACHRENSSLGYPQHRNEFAGKTCSWNTVCIRHERAGVQKDARN